MIGALILTTLTTAFLCLLTLGATLKALELLEQRPKIKRSDYDGKDAYLDALAKQEQTRIVLETLTDLEALNLDTTTKQHLTNAKNSINQQQSPTL
jgi:hypothetical protein